MNQRNKMHFMALLSNAIYHLMGSEIEINPFSISERL